MNIRPMEDLVAPLAVTAIDLTFESQKPEWNTYASYIVAGGAYLAAVMGKPRGDFVKNMGIASFPWAAKNIYRQVRGLAAAKPAVSRLAFKSKPVSRYPAPAFDAQFQGTRLT